MKIKFPGNCNNEASRWSFCTRLNEKLRLWHNGECVGMAANQAEAWRKANFYNRINAVMLERNDQIVIAKQGTFWNPRVPDHVSGGAISYPPGLDQENEGSRAVFLFGVMDKLQGLPPDDIDIIAVQDALGHAQQDAIGGTFWSPSLEDIINV